MGGSTEMGLDNDNTLREDRLPESPPTTTSLTARNDAFPAASASDAATQPLDLARSDTEIRLQAHYRAGAPYILLYKEPKEAGEAARGRRGGAHEPAWMPALWPTGAPGRSAEEQAGPSSPQDDREDSVSEAGSLACMMLTPPPVTMSRAPRGPAAVLCTPMNTPEPGVARAHSYPAAISGAVSQEALGRASEVTKEVEPGVFVSTVLLPDGSRELRRVRFSQKRFKENDAQKWWEENKARIFSQFNIVVPPPVARITSTLSTPKKSRDRTRDKPE
ncbi:hypothetical protein CYMTET_18967 [Cymbomonas tetramitiformis]|uniref:BRX domain-containing protein n=1 Tax=Cymbomonas tetramitiformis TaxID=36881 RepID=A0AAE0G737_9CHLO|nr:hypothetical protein CYMTET_18967 [Cymbomonas tetramitiformis]